jgi:hypothetical protein
VLIAALRSVVTYVVVSLYVLIVAPPGMLIALFGATPSLRARAHRRRLGLVLSGIRLRVAGLERRASRPRGGHCANPSEQRRPPVLFHGSPILHILTSWIDAIPA